MYQDFFGTYGFGTVLSEVVSPDVANLFQPVNSMGVKHLYSGFEARFAPAPFSNPDNFCAILKKGERCYNVFHDWLSSWVSASMNICARSILASAK